MSRLLASVLLACALLLPVPANAEPTCDGERCSLATTSSGMVFVANTGLEDLQTLSSSLRHAVAAKRSGHLDEVVWLVYGRAILAVDGRVQAVPDEIRAHLREARAAGVRVVACEAALQRFDIPTSALPEGIDTVPNAVAELARYVGKGYSVIRY